MTISAKRNKFEIDGVVNTMVSHMPTELFESSTTKFLDPACGGGQFIKAIVARLTEAGHSAENIKSRVFGYETNRFAIRDAKFKLKNSATIEKVDFLTTNFDNMNDFVVVSNPPYQDGNKKGGQNKIYNLFCKRALELGNIVAMITPTSVCKKSKRFSLLGLEGLKRVDFTANNHFNVGVKICSWIVDKSYDGDVEVIYDDSTISVPKGAPIYDTNDNSDFRTLYTKCKELTEKLEDRMFRQNNFGPALSKIETDKHLYQLYKLKDGEKQLTYYSSRVPYYVGSNKLSVGMTKSLSNDAIYVGTEDFDPGYMTIEVANEQEVENIKSFILSDYFIEHCNNWKSVDGYGYNYGIKYLPHFDKTRPWTNEEVKDFFESLLPKNTQKIYDRVMDLCQDTKKADNRMFKRNNHGPAFSPTESEQHRYPIYCNNRGNEYYVYTRRQPVFHKEQKLIISNTKALKEENIVVDDRDYGPSYFAYPVTTDAEVENIKSFVLSEYFVTLAQEFRRIRGGQNTVLIDYCPVFDKTRPWTNEEVKDFFENL